MSQRRYLEFEIRGSPGNVDSVLNRFNAGLSNTQRTLRQSQRDLSLWDRQLLAIGTTLRYAFAGSVVFGIAGAVSRLGEFEQALGRIEARAARINQQGGLMPMGGGAPEQMAQSYMRASVQFGIATEDIESYAERFWSAFDPPGGVNNRIRQQQEFINTVSRMRRVLGPELGDPARFAGTIAGLVHGIPGGTQNIGASTNRIANIAAYTLWRTPGFLGSDITLAGGRLQSAMGAGRMTPEQAFSVLGAAGMRGGSSGVIIRGVTQLLADELIRPQTETQLQAFRQVGLPTDPGQLRQLGGWQVLMRMMNAVRTGPVSVRNRQALGAEDMAPEAAVAAAGVGGIDVTLASRLFGQQESFRQFINLVTQGPEVLQEWNRSLQDATKNNFLAQQDAIVARRNWQAEFTEARRVLGLQAIRALRWPLENLIADPTTWLAEQTTLHPRVTQVAAGGAATVAAGAALNRIFGGRLMGGRAGRALGRITGVSREVAGQALTTEALPNLVEGGAADGTRANPIWVIIHPTSWYVGQPGGFPGGGDRTPPVVATGGRLSRIARNTGIAGLAAAGGLAGWEVGKWLSEEGTPTRRANDWVEGLFSGGGGGNAAGLARGIEAANQARIARVQGRAAAMQYAAPIGPPAPGRSAPLGVEGHASLDVTVRMVDAQGRPVVTERREGVPVRLWGAGGAPTTRGRQRSSGRRGGR